MTLIFLLNLYCDSLLCGMQQAVCCVWTQGRCRGPAARDERPVTAPGSVQGQGAATGGSLPSPCCVLKASGKPGQRGIGRCGKWDGPGKCCQAATGFLCSPEWVLTTGRWTGTVWIFYSVNLALLLYGGWGVWFITYKNLDSPWLNVKALASVRKFMNFTHMIIDDFY